MFLYSLRCLLFRMFDQYYLYYNNFLSNLTADFVGVITSWKYFISFPLIYVEDIKLLSCVSILFPGSCKECTLPEL
jgi:hypothetical protein